MKPSYYFAELAAAYDAELQDLLNDSEGKSALAARLAEKRQALAAILPMIDFSPEMVIPVFYDGLVFDNVEAMRAAIRCEPEDGDFPAWDDLAPSITFAAWARPLLDAVLAESTGENFMVTVAGLEFLRKFAHAAPSLAADGNDDEREEEGGDGDDDERDLGEAGDDWLADQGFDSNKA